MLVAEQGVSGEHHISVANQSDAVRGMPGHVHDLQATDRVAVQWVSTMSRSSRGCRPIRSMNPRMRLAFPGSPVSTSRRPPSVRTRYTLAIRMPSTLSTPSVTCTRHIMKRDQAGTEAD